MIDAQATTRLENGMEQPLWQSPDIDGHRSSLEASDRPTNAGDERTPALTTQSNPHHHQQANNSYSMPFKTPLTPGTPVKQEFVYPNKLERGDGADQNGITVDRWETGLFNCCDDCIPNGFLAFFCPVISLAQISVRLGLASYAFLLGMHVALYLLGVVAAAAEDPLLLCLCAAAEVITTIGIIRLRATIRGLFFIPGTILEDAAAAILCRPCAIAQMATHVEAYHPGQCMFRARDTLPGYARH